MQVTIRLSRRDPIQYTEQAVCYRIDGNKVWFPLKSIKVTEHDNFTDVDMPKWLCSAKELEDYVVAEF